MSLRIKSNGVTIQMKVTEQYFHKVLLNFTLFFFLHLLGYLNLTPFLKNGYSCALLNRPFRSCPMPLFQSEAKCEAIHIYFPAKKTDFHKKGFSLCLALKVRVFETRK